MASSSSPADRVVVLAPSAHDGPITVGLLRRAGVAAVEARDARDLCRLLEEGAAAALVAEEVFVRGQADPLAAWLSHQPPWSDLPVIVFTAAGAAASARSAAVDLLVDRANLTLLDRPVRVITLLSAVSAALRARRHQYRMRDLLARLADSVRTRDQFLAMLGHELRNPLAAIHTATELVLRDPSQPERPASIIARQARKLARLVDDLLEVSRVESGKIALQRGVLDLRGAVERSVEAMVARAERAGLDLEVVLPAEPLPVDGDGVRLEQVIGNLLANALKYTPAGGAVTVAAERRADQAIVRVTDTGVGVASDQLHRIFEPFAQVATTLDRSDGGLGLGLALVRGLVVLHGGTVEARSEGPGRGTEVEVRLPLAATPAAATAGPPDVREDAAPEAPRRHVLVVEDNPDNLDTLVMLLESFGHDVVAATDGPSGVRMAESARPEVAIIDIGLPGLDGYEVGRRLRTLLGADVTLVALTGYGQADDRERARAAGFDVHLTKPADAATVAGVVARAAASRRPGAAPQPAP